MVWNDRADQLAVNIMKFSPWDASNGVIHEGNMNIYLSIILRSWPSFPDISVDVAFRCLFIFSPPIGLLDVVLILSLGILIRALFQHWSLSPPHSQISELVKAFLLVQVCAHDIACQDRHALHLQQYNNLLNNVRYPGTNLFSPDWNGISSSTPSPLGQLVALSVLTPAIVLASNESESTSTA